jgi:soluble lytic murein transglycosylase
MTHRLFVFCFGFTLLFVLCSVGCSAQQTEEQALQSLREMTRDGKLPSEAFVANIESRFAGKKTGALAKLLRARIRFENKDFAGAAALLSSDVFAKNTSLGDYALWLRGQALQQAGNHAEAINIFAKLLQDYPDSVRATNAKLLSADSAIASGQAATIPGLLGEMADAGSPDALLRIARSYESLGDQTNSIKYYRRVYFYGAGSDAAKDAEAKLTTLAQPLTPQTAEEAQTRADKLFNSKNWTLAEKAYADLVLSFPASLTPAANLKRLTVLANLKKMPDAQSAFNAIPATAKEKEEAYYQLAIGYAKARLWPNARQSAEEMRQKFPSGKLTAKTFIDAGLAAREAKNRVDEGYFLKTAVASFPNAVEVALAQFELAWFEHESGNFAQSSQMFVEHLARYADKDTSNRGKAGYWAARDSEKAGKFADACALYDAVNYRYSANWYGHLGMQRQATLKSQGKCSGQAANSLIVKASTNLKSVTVAAETATQKELARAEKSDQLSTIGLFDWAIDELSEAKKTAQNSPKINIALARHYRLKGDNVSALLALAKSYPDYSQMFPEEMGREEWDIFYPLTNWDQIRAWAKNRSLDPYQVAGLIRQESVFNPRAKSGANAYGLMQLLLPTARSVARKYGSTANLSSADTLYLPAANIELGTAYMRDQFDKFGRIEYVAVAYNAGPGRVPQWRATLPIEIDEFVEEIPFKETKGYVQGVIRNSAQYRRLYDDNGNFKSNVGTRQLRGEIDSRPREELAAEFPDVVIDESSGG